MNRDLLIRRNTIEVNKVASKCLRITVLFLISLWMFASSNYYNYDEISVMIVFVASIVLLLIPTVLVDVLHMEHLWIKYYVIMCCMAVVFLLGTFISYNYIVLLVFPLLIATIYCDKKLIVTVSVIDCICVFAVMFLRYMLFKGEISESYESVTEAVVYGGFLRIVMVLLTTLFSYYIVERNMVMLDKTIDNLRRKFGSKIGRASCRERV